MPLDALAHHAIVPPPVPAAHPNEPLASHPSTIGPVPTQPTRLVTPSTPPADAMEPPASYPLPRLTKSALNNPSDPFDHSLLAQIAQQPRTKFAQMAAEAANMVYQKSLQARAARAAAERAAQIASDHAAHAEGAAKMAASAIQHAQMDAGVLNAQALGHTAAAVGVPTPGDYSMAATDLTSEPIIRSMPLEVLYLPPPVELFKRPNECGTHNFF
eukprot:GEMP01049120.1.p1 GENE.GEMP01049120.1~~GEMP01049120.1.p1  ORF type:complete len:215 (+),score=70.60 GEMP01049120.1:168-812(+)